jgi:truncated hemoglobin YjbI
MSYPLDEKRFDPWLKQFDAAVTAVLSEHTPPDDPPVTARLAAA